MLENLFTKYGTNKHVLGYTGYYERFLERSRFHVRRVLEIGICGHLDFPNNVVGASLFAWRDYFPNAEIYGIDNDGRFIFNDQQRIRTALCDAYDKDALHRALVGFGGGPFDLIIDDAVHDPGPQIALANQLVNWLIPGGYYFIEDVCPYKMPHTNIDMGLLDHLNGFSGAVALTTPYPEAIVAAIK